MNTNTKYHLSEIKEDETVIEIIHRSWFYIAEQYFVVLVMAGVFFAAAYFFPVLFPDAFGTQVQKILLFVQNSFLIAIWIYGFLIWIDYYFDVWVITSERIINIEQKGLFVRKISELKYSKIQDVTSEVTGFLQTVVNFGDVTVQTAGEEENFLFRTISDPYRIKEMIMNQMHTGEREGIDQLGKLLEEKINHKEV